MTDYRVNLDIFAGPLDLLLYLVRKEEVDIYDIPIAQITDQYIRYLEMLKNLDIDLAADFLVMAATLMQIKSVMLLPKADLQLQSVGLEDPRAQLIRQLLEYKKFKDAANLLAAAADSRMERFARPPAIIDRLSTDSEPQIDLEQVSVWDILEAFDSLCKATGVGIKLQHIKDDTPIDLYQIEILHRLQTEGPLTFERLFDRPAGRIIMIGLFLALLELIREKLVWAEQPALSSSIYLRPLTNESPEQAVRNAILAIAEAEAKNAVPAGPAPIPISQLPAEAKPAVALDVQKQPAEKQPAGGPIPISELPPKESIPAPAFQQQEILPAEEPEHQEN